MSGAGVKLFRKRRDKLSTNKAPGCYRLPGEPPALGWLYFQDKITEVPPFRILKPNHCSHHVPGLQNLTVPPFIWPSFLKWQEEEETVEGRWQRTVKGPSVDSIC